MTTWTSPRPRRVSLHLWAYRHRAAIVASVGGVFLLLLLALGYYTSLVVRRFDGRRWNLPSRIYSDLFVLREGDFASPEKLAAKLERLLYPGRAFRGFSVRVDFSAGKVLSIRDPSGQPAPALVLEPERLGSVFGEE